MKLLTILPPNWGEYFKNEIKRSERWIVYADPTAGNLIKLFYPANTANAGGEWVLLISPQYQKRESLDYLYGINFKLFPYNGEGLPKAKMIREDYKSVFPYTLQPSLFTCAVPHPYKPKIWVSYSFCNE